MSHEISVVLPAYNAVSEIRTTVTTLLSWLDTHGIDGEVIVSDDGSTDGTSAAVPAVDRVRCVQLPRNRGKGAAVRAGMRLATGRIRAYTDSDLPYGTAPLVLARRYIDERGFHAVLGDRTLPGSWYAHEGLARRMASESASFTFRTLVTGGIFDTQCGFKAFRGDVASELFRLSRIDGFAMDVELIYVLLKHRLDIKRIPVQLRYNAGSSVRVLRDSARAAGDILTMRLNWARGAYRSPSLEGLLTEETMELQAPTNR